MEPLFPASHYLLRRQVQGLRGDFRLSDPNGQVTACARHIVGRLHDDIHLHADDAGASLLLTLRAHARPGTYPSYALFDPRQPGQALAWFQRRPWRWPPYDVWQVDGADERPLGYLSEAGLFQAGLRLLFWGGLVPQRYALRAGPPDSLSQGGAPLARYQQDPNIFRYRLAVDFPYASAGRLDHRIGVAAAFLLAIGEGFYAFRPFQQPRQADHPAPII